jgi:3-isopropylmalate dehydrogenase
MVVVRENTEDVYVGKGRREGKGTPDERAVAEMVFTRRGVERAIRYACDLARMPGRRRKVTLVDKANAIRAQEIWRDTFHEVLREYPDLESEELYVDAATMLMVADPARFDVIVTTNLFGDILTDLGAVIQGGLGSAASGNINPGQVSMFEPIHGSAPDIAGRDIASPIGAILAVAMMLRFLGEAEAADLVEGAVRALLETGRIPRLDASSGLTTEQQGDMVAAEVVRLALSPA